MAEMGNVVILNPGAAGGQTMKLLPRIHGILKRVDATFAIYVTKEPGDAIGAARRFAEDGATRIIAVGGDGTVNEVVNGIYQSGKAAALGVVPVGHGTDLARTLKISGSIEQSVLHACERAPRPVDLGLARWDDGSERVFINIAGLGFDAIVAAKASKSKLPGSNLPYLGSALSALIGYHNLGVTIVADGETITTKGVFVQIANAQYMGGGFHFAPMAEMDDGLLDLCIVGDFSKAELLRQIPGVYRGKHVGHPKFTHKRAASIRIEPDRRADVQLDGEVLAPAPVTFTVLPGALQLV
ncbi:MAG TPA: diacylglycerol kinase family lipid kinase [Thermomicrobiales bacterium]|nr:diacylglycerol kinase family lipid kinase [Thermomicrobiales bacterium]